MGLRRHHIQKRVRHSDWPGHDRLSRQVSLEIIPYRLGGTVPITWILLQALQTDGLKVAIESGIVLRRGHRRDIAHQT